MNLHRIISFFIFILVSVQCFSIDIFAEKSKDSHQILILIPENELAQNSKQKMIRINSEINIEIFRNKTKPIYQVTKNLQFDVLNRISENANIPIFLSPNLKGGYYRFSVEVYNKIKDTKKVFKKIVSVPRRAGKINNIYLFAYENGNLIAPTIPIIKKNNYDSLKVIGSFKNRMDEIKFQFNNGKSYNYKIDSNKFAIKFPNEKYDKTKLRIIYGAEKFYQNLDFFTFNKRFQFTYSLKAQLQQLSFIIKNSDLRYLKSVPKLQLQTEINKFWHKNNPNSEYGHNQFQRIFYQRIIYADKNFTIRGYMPGWKTDRGKIYLKYGEPDDILKNNYPIKSKSSIVWKYYKIDKNFVFYDFKGYGNYELEDRWNEE